MFDIANGSAEYHKFDVPTNGTIDKLTFTFSDTGEKAKKHQRRALLRFGSASAPSWREEYWKEDEKTLCLKGDYENLGQIVLVYSNSELDKPFDASYSVNSQGECPVEVVGRTIQRWTVSTDLPGQAYSKTGTFTSKDEIEYDDDEGAFVIRKRSVSCIERSSGRVDQELPGGLRFQVTSSSSASGENVEEYSGDERPIKISFDEEEKKFKFIVTPGAFKNPKWVKNVITENGQTRVEERGCGGTLGVVNVLEFPMEPPYYFESNGVRRVRGTKEFSYKGVSGTVELDYVLTEKPPQ
ncbi:MAG: hypothetical protein QW343_03580 [Candidatus Norongarragalinales archaeon]